MHEAAITFRVARESDIAAMAEIRLAVRENRLADPRAITREMYEDHLGRTGRSWVCEHDGRVIGFSSASAADASIWALFVRPEAEGLGAGRGLLDLAVEWLFSLGHERVTLSTEAGTRADVFYQARGWRRGSMKDETEVVFTLLRSPAGR